jgi:hypothetical protein
MSCGQYDYDQGAEQPRQQRDWDCSAAATAWMGRALGWGWAELDVAYAFLDQGIASQQLGLLDGTGAGIVRWLSQQPLPAENRRGSWALMEARDWSCPAIMGSSRWYHWTGVRGFDQDGNLWLANSAPGWGGIYQTLTAEQFAYFGDFWVLSPTGE